jgi:hypothetical protein
LAYPAERLLFFIVLGIWFSVSIATEKFLGRSNRNYTLALGQWWKADIITLVLIAVVVFGFRLFYFSRLQSLGAIGVLMLLEAVALRVYFLWVRGGGQAKDVESLEVVRKILGQETIREEVDIESLRNRLLEPVKERLREKLADEGELFGFISKHVELDKILCMEAVSDGSQMMFFLGADQMPVRFILKMNKINDTRRINSYLLEAHGMLIPGGYLVIRAHTTATHKEWLFAKYPGYIAKYIYAADFLVHRVIPKLPFFKKIYFAVTRGKGRVISRAEILGRLHFCGFEIVDEATIDKRLCVIARKSKLPAADPNPTYGPFVELRRVGYNNEIIKVYKVRTMHPYSEYLQEYVYRISGLRKGGKLENDFRLTGYGKLMRKLWIDELPMLYNWVKGELQLIGVRPLSMQYFNLYDKELQEMRGLVKPGLLPPFYADMPESVEEIIESEKRYIRAFLERPQRTQFVYLVRILKNILIKGARSK